MVRYDLISPRERKDGKTFWVKVGSAFERDQGGFSLVFDALPLPDKEGNVRLLMTEPKQRQDGGNMAKMPASREIDDEIPF
jgi:hypothetical protein